MESLKEKGFWDYTGATISWVCAIHCLLMPFVIMLLPLVGLSFLADEKTEWIIIGISVIVGLISLLPSYFSLHKQLRVLMIFIAGIGLITFSQLTFEESIWKYPFVILGAVFITLAHLINRRLCYSCHVCKTQATESLRKTDS